MLKVITGPMFSGKTNRLLNLLGDINGKIVYSFKPTRDTRSENKIVSRTGVAAEAIEVKNLKELIHDVKWLEKEKHCEINAILIDEIQFLKGSNRDMLKLKSLGIDIYASGLNLTSELKPFKQTQKFLAYADEVEVLTANCKYCGNPASYTNFLGKKNKKVLIGNLEYEPICFNCLKEKYLRKNF